MSEAMPAVVDVEKQWRLPPAQAERLTAYARSRGISEEEAVCHALDLLEDEEEVTVPGSDLPELAAPSDWEVEVPIVFDVPLPPAVWVRATVVDLGPVSCEPVVEEEFLDVEEEAWT